MQGVSKTYRPPGSWSDWFAGRWRRAPVLAVADVSLKVHCGSAVGLVGANGAGKTTLLRLAAGMLAPTTGAVTISRGPAVYVLGDSRSFYWRLTGRQNLEFFAALYGLGGAHRTRRINEALELVALSDCASRPFREYSTGMRQRLAIARGLLAEPRLLLLDEITRGLDAEVRERVLEFLRHQMVGARGCGVIFSSHVMEEIRMLCTRTLRMEAGRLVQDGLTADVLA